MSNETATVVLGLVGVIGLAIGLASILLLDKREDKGEDNGQSK